MASVFADGDFVFLEKGRQGLLASLAFRENRMRHFRCLLVDFSAYARSTSSPWSFRFPIWRQ